MKSSSMNILHIAAECYPAAKTGGLGDILGSLPKYLNERGVNSSVVMPKYKMPWFHNQKFTSVYGGNFYMGSEHIYYHIERVDDDPLGFTLYTIDIPGKYDRDGVYADSNGHFFRDEVERMVSFNRSFLDWLSTWSVQPDVIHCHDHHTGLIPFMMKYCPRYSGLKNLPSVFTIHNERYQGAFKWDRSYLLPGYDSWKSGMLDWNNTINPLASAVKCSWQVTTVSPSYMEELKNNSFGLEGLFQSEAFKSRGILNGIDYDYWNPFKDEMIKYTLKKSITSFKLNNKKKLLEGTVLDLKIPTISFIGRLAYEKGADLVPMLIDHCLSYKMPVQWIVLGTGDKSMENQLRGLSQKFPAHTFITIAYDEALAHQIYAASDFIIMPSRVEPCGLNQMYAMRYGTVPIVHNIGGLKDSVVDLGAKEGSGIKVEQLSINDLAHAVYRAIQAYENKKAFNALRKRIMELDFSWDHSAQAYIEMYKLLK